MKEPKPMRNLCVQNNRTEKEESFQESVLQIVHGTTGNAALRDDLAQEAFVHLWLIKSRRPGQTRSWYLQSCKFHLRHYLNSGRSIDSAKRRASQVPIESDSSDSGEDFDLIDTGASVFSIVSARDLIALLSHDLRPEEKAVLDCLADGLGSREIGRKLKVSHTLIMRRRRMLAGRLRELETISVRNGIKARLPVENSRGDRRHARLQRPYRDQSSPAPPQRRGASLCP